MALPRALPLMLMRENKNPIRPYRTLGWYLKFAREQIKETLPEVSGAVEIEVEELQKIERGESRPSEDVLTSLISHLGLEGAEATSLWDLAGYSDGQDAAPTDDLKQQIALVMPVDLRIVYTDMAHIMASDNGIVMNFMQGGGPGNQPLAVARVGMSKKHARSVLDVLSRALDSSTQSSKPKYLSAPKKRSDSKETK